MFKVGKFKNSSYEIYHLDDSRDQNNICSNNFIAHEIGMSAEDYCDYLCDNLNGFYSVFLLAVAFRTRHDAERALDWVNSMIIMRKLAE